MILFTAAAVAADLWSIPARESPVEDAWEAQARAAYAVGMVPEFRTADRDRLAAGLGADVRFGRVRLALAGDWLRDTTAAGPAVQGFGDLHLGSAVRVVSFGPVDTHVGWAAKLPNASDGGELGTDETDVSFGLSVGATFGDVRLVGAVGLAILGNPLRFANQDDVPLLRLQADWSGWNLSVSPSLRWDLATARNPDRAEAALMARFGPTWFVEAGGTAGLSPASADFSGHLGLGWRAALPVDRRGE